MDKYQVDIAVAIVFFNRDDSLKEVFERVRAAKPSKVFLIQDGARANHEGEYEDVLKCRRVFDNIDWDCEIYRNFSNKNMGCGRRVSSGISWVFEHVDQAIILEDDCVIEPTFIPFCAELLEKYKDDRRVSMISGLNHFVDWDCGGNSYFFTKTGAIAAWATWKRVWDDFDFTVSGMEDPYTQRLLSMELGHRRASRTCIPHWLGIQRKQKAGEKIRFWGSQWGLTKYLQGGLAIVPAHSLSNNVGVNAKATFSGDGLEFMPKPMRGWFFQQTKPMEFPLKHPKVMLTDKEYDKKYYDITYPSRIKGLMIRGFYFLKRKVYKAAFRKHAK